MIWSDRAGFERRAKILVQPQGLVIRLLGLETCGYFLN
jgi:hypothetical protein